MAGLQDNTLRIVLVGKTGNGKSATANSILGQRVFDSRIAAESVTKSCQKEERDWKGRKLLVVDTPGLFDTKQKISTTCEEIAKCVLYSCPGPHAIILVVQLGRFTQEEHNTVKLVKFIFGKQVMKHMMVLFTRKDQLDGEELSSFIANSDESLKTIITDCHPYCIAFNNRSADEAEKEAQLQQLVELIEAMVQENGGAHFSDPIYKHTEEAWKRVEASLNKISDEREAEQKEVKMKHDEEQISKEEMEKEMASIDEKYEKEMKSAREEGEENIRRGIFQRIWRALLNVWDSFWE